MIQFMRFVPQALERVARVVLELPEDLLVLPLPHERLQLVPRGAALPRHDLWVPLMSLPGLLGLGAGPLGDVFPYIQPGPATPVQARARRIGLCWAGSPLHSNDHNRSMPDRFLAALNGLPETSFVGLTRGAPPPPLERHVDPFGATGSLQAYRGLLQSLDLVITVDTSVAHLAGALGRPVWVLLSAAADWRWLEDREDSPWYPSARLFRQATVGDWAGLMARVRSELERPAPP